MTISILLRTKNSEASVRRIHSCLEAGDQLVVVDHASVDATVETAKRLGCAVVTLAENEFSYGLALNRGVVACAADWIIVMSPHVHPIGDRFWAWLRRDLSELDARIVACQVPVFFANGKERARPGLTVLGIADLPLGPWRIYGNTFCAYRRDALATFPFDESLPTAEDVEWCQRVVKGGLQVAIDHRVAVLYRNRAPLRRYWKRGRTDFPTLYRIFGASFRPTLREFLEGGVAELAMVLTGRIPPWLWLRLTVKRLAEFSLRFAPPAAPSRRV